MSKREITSAQMRKELKDLGYKVRIKSGSSFSTATVNRDGIQVTGFNVITPEFLDEHKAFFDWRNQVSVVDDGWRTIL